MKTRWQLASKGKLVILPIALALFGCNHAGRFLGPREVEKKPTVPTRLLVCGIDRTGRLGGSRAPETRRAAAKLCADVVKMAGPGDEVIVRYISDRSAGDDQEVCRVILPGGARTCSNKFDRRCSHLALKERQLLASARDEAVRKVEAADVTPARHTDIFGFMQAAAYAFERAPDRVHELYVASDLDDNKRFKLAPRLSETKVTVFLFQNGKDPEGVEARKANWDRLFHEWGARSVDFRPSQVIR